MATQNQYGSMFNVLASRYKELENVTNQRHKAQIQDFSKVKVREATTRHNHSRERISGRVSSTPSPRTSPSPMALESICHPQPRYPAVQLKDPADSVCQRCHMRRTSEDILPQKFPRSSEFCNICPDINVPGSDNHPSPKRLKLFEGSLSYLSPQESDETEWSRSTSSSMGKVYTPSSTDSTPASSPDVPTDEYDQLDHDRHTDAELDYYNRTVSSRRQIQTSHKEWIGTEQVMLLEQKRSAHDLPTRTKRTVMTR